jgi:hypothetical protein
LARTRYERGSIILTSNKSYGDWGTIFGDPAYLNSYGKSRAAMEKEVDQHIAAGNFQTSEVDAKPLSAGRDYKEQPLLSKEVRLAQADLLVGEPSRRE